MPKSRLSSLLQTSDPHDEREKRGIAPATKTYLLDTRRAQTSRTGDYTSRREDGGSLSVPDQKPAILSGGGKPSRLPEKKRHAAVTTPLKKAKHVCDSASICSRSIDLSTF